MVLSDSEQRSDASVSTAIILDIIPRYYKLGQNFLQIVKAWAISKHIFRKIKVLLISMGLEGGRGCHNCRHSSRYTLRNRFRESVFSRN